MAKTIEKLTALGVGRYSAPGYYGDGGGLYLSVGPSGNRSWIFRYTFDGRRREMGLGAVHTLGLSEARDRARAMRRMLLDGIDPLADRDQQRVAEKIQRDRLITFDAAAKQYILAHGGTWKNAKHRQQWEATLATYASPRIGTMPVAEIETRDVVDVLQPIWTTKGETASRLRGRIESILDWATVCGYRDGLNPARWKGHLDKALAKVSRRSRIEHHPSLPWQQMQPFMTALREREGAAARALEFAILTAARSGEVRGMTWAEVDIEARLWTVPATRMKAGVQHRVPVTDAALAVLAAMPRGEPDDLVFAAPRSGGAMSDMAMTALLRRMNRGDITTHGFRSSFRTWAAESAASSFGREAAEHALAHKLPDAVEAAYNRTDLLDRRRGLMDAWARHCTVSVPATVTPIREVAA